MYEPFEKKEKQVNKAMSPLESTIRVYLVVLEDEFTEENTASTVW